MEENLEEFTSQLQEITIHENPVVKTKERENYFEVTVRPEFDIHMTGLNRDLDGFKVPFVEPVEDGKLKLSVHSD